MNFYLDFEATQFSNRIISIGCTNEKGSTFKTYVRPKNGKLNAFITELTGITPAMLENAPVADEAFNMFYEWAITNCEDGTPKYFCYGDSDAKFIDATVRTMSDFPFFNNDSSNLAITSSASPPCMKSGSTSESNASSMVSMA